MKESDADILIGIVAAPILIKTLNDNPLLLSNENKYYYSNI